MADGPHPNTEDGREIRKNSQKKSNVGKENERGLGLGLKAKAQSGKIWTKKGEIGLEENRKKNGPRLTKKREHTVVEDNINETKQVGLKTQSPKGVEPKEHRLDETIVGTSAHMIVDQSDGMVKELEGESYRLHGELNNTSHIQISRGKHVEITLQTRMGNERDTLGDPPDPRR